MGQAHIWAWPGPCGPSQGPIWARPMGRAHGPGPGPGPPVLGQEHFSETVSWKTLMLHISLNIEIWVVWQKRRAPENDEIWRRLRAEISHMRPIQARKLKLFREPICDKVTLIYINVLWLYQKKQTCFHPEVPWKIHLITATIQADTGPLDWRNQKMPPSS